MAREALSAPLLALALEPEGGQPLHRQLYGQLREAVLRGRLAPGLRLPSSRALARELGCSRNTVLAAFEQLLSEGYLEGRAGSGTYVSPVLPEQLLAAAPAPARAAASPAASPVPVPGLSRRGARLAEGRPPARGPLRPFLVGVPDTAFFPFDVWSRLLARCWRHPPAANLRHGAPGGHAGLRRLIADYLRRVRALDCAPEQVLITAGAQQGLDLMLRLLLDPGDRVWLEEPGYAGFDGPLRAAGAEAVPVPLDAEGLSVAAGRARAADARVVAVTPSHQYPLGVTMSLARRLELLAWAREAGAWILEDDYDSEFRYAGRPLAALQGLDGPGFDGRSQVIYLGTFSKILFPALRLGYVVVPPQLVEPLARARIDDHPSLVTQPALAAFIEEGHFAAHVRRMRALYAERQQALLHHAGRRLAGALDLAPDPAGLHLVARLGPALAGRLDDRAVAARAAGAGVTLAALSGYYRAPPGPQGQGLLFGYAAFDAPAIARAVERLAWALEG